MVPGMTEPINIAAHGVFDKRADAYKRRQNADTM
jgi:hypothetical protein